MQEETEYDVEMIRVAYCGSDDELAEEREQTLDE